MRTNLLTWALFCVCWEQALAATVTCNSTCYGAQVAALADLYTSTTGSEWLQAGDWATIPTLSTTDISAVCTILSESLTGLCCDYTQSACDYSTDSYGVAALVLAGQNLQGTLPTSLLTALAPTLLFFIISGKEVFSIRSENYFCSCHYDVTVVSGNQLTGTLPDLAQLTLATDLLLAKNKFTGTIPAAVLELPSAVRMDLVSCASASCRATGFVVTSGSLSTQADALQGGNMLTGTVPFVETGPNMSLLYLDHNRLTGTFPLLYTATLMHVFDLSSNQISGTLALPDTSSSTTSDSTEYTTRYLGLDASFGYAVNLLFGNNEMTGSLPAWLASLALTVSLQSLNNCPCDVDAFIHAHGHAAVNNQLCC